MIANKDYNMKDDQYLGPYLAGLFEGDGHVAIKDKSLKHPKPTFHITFHKKDLPLAQKLYDLIACRAGSGKVGSIFVHKYNNSCVLNIYSVPGLIAVVNLINGCLKTPKRFSITRIIDWLNAKHGACLVQKNVCVKPVGQNAWFAGFTDADGSFGIDLRRVPRFKLSCQWQLNQRQIDPATGFSYAPCLNKLVAFLGSRRLYLITPKKGNSYFAIKATSAKSKQILRDYYTRMPLQSSKRYDYFAWCTVDDMIYSSHASKKVDQIELLIMTMNTKRSSFDWSHLEF